MVGVGEGEGACDGLTSGGVPTLKTAGPGEEHVVEPVVKKDRTGQKRPKGRRIGEVWRLPWRTGGET